MKKKSKKKSKKKKKVIPIIISENPAIISFGNYYLDLEKLVDSLNEKYKSSIINNEVIENLKGDDLAVFVLKTKKIKYVQPSRKMYDEMIGVFKKYVQVGGNKTS